MYHHVHVGVSCSSIDVVSPFIWSGLFRSGSVKSWMSQASLQPWYVKEVHITSNHSICNFSSALCVCCTWTWGILILLIWWNTYVHIGNLAVHMISCQSTTVTVLDEYFNLNMLCVYIDYDFKANTRNVFYTWIAQAFDFLQPVPRLTGE